MRGRLITRVSLGRLKAFEALAGPQRRRILLPMAEEFARISRANFGASGKYRVSRWLALNPKYRRWKVRHGGQPLADLILSGKLKASIRSECRNDNYAEVHAGEGTDYAAAHQFDTGHMPYRPFLPTDRSGRPTAYAAKRLKQVAELELKRILR